MKKSESIAELAGALTQAQAEMSGAKKQSANPFFKSKYADLKEVIECIKEPFSNNGLSFSQMPMARGNTAGVETIIMHTSGEWISQRLLLTCAKNDPQGMGSAITYARRYALQAAAGVPSEDDDGNVATRGKSDSKKQAPKAPKESAYSGDSVSDLKKALIAEYSERYDQSKDESIVAIKACCDDMGIKQLNTKGNISAVRSELFKDGS